MAKVVEERGFFWWFNEPDLPAHSKETSVPALLVITDDGQITLDVEGSLSGNDEHRDWNKSRNLSALRRIAGLLASPNEYVLLEGLERTDFSLDDASPQQQAFTAQSCTRRDLAFAETYGDDDFVELRGEMTGLEDWLELDSFLVSTEHDDGTAVHVDISYRKHQLTYSVFGGTLSIESITTGADTLGFSSRYPQRDLKFEQTYYLVFRPESPSHISSLRYCYSRLEEFLALLLGAYYRFDWPIVVRKEEPFDVWDKVYFHRGEPASQTINRHFSWIPFSRMRDAFGSLFEEWQKGIEAYGAGYYLYVSSLRNPYPYAEDRFVNLVWALEALHRKWLAEPESSPRIIEEKKRVERILNQFSKDDKDQRWLRKKLAHAHEPSLETRILECLRKLPFTFGRGQLEQFAKSCAIRRNDISHEGGPRGDMDYESFHVEITRLAEALDHLYHALLLHQMGIAPRVLLEAMTSSWVSERRLKPALANVGLDIKAASSTQSGDA